MKTYVIRHQSGGGDVDEIVNVTNDEDVARHVLSSWNHLVQVAPYEVGIDDEHAEVILALGNPDDDSEVVWIEAHELVTEHPRRWICLELNDSIPWHVGTYDTQQEAFDHYIAYASDRDGQTQDELREILVDLADDMFTDSQQTWSSDCWELIIIKEDENA